MNPYAINYDSTADIDDESCVYDDTICDCSGTVHTLGVLVWVGDGFADDSAYEWEDQLVDFDCKVRGMDLLLLSRRHSRWSFHALRLVYVW